MWSPTLLSSPSVPYTLFCDCTVRLDDGNRLSGVDFASRDAAEQWYRHERELYRGAKAIFTASDYARRSLIEHYGIPSDRITIVGYGINQNAPERLDRGYDNETMLFVGYEFERKGGPVLLRAFEQVRRQLPAARLLIAGPKHPPASLPDGVEWIGTVGRDQLARLYERASLFVMPSLFEPFGLVYLEAMEWKLPCVGSAACAMPEIVLDGRSGRLVKAGDVDELAVTLVDLLREPDRLRAMGECGRSHARDRFPWPKVASRVDAGLRRALAQRQTGSSA
jgi:glycosyltransferase involved in cell wall biosynthesis